MRGLRVWPARSRARQQQDDQARRRAGAHQADAPDLAGQRSEAGADLDVELVEQVLAHRRLVHAVGHAHRVQRPQPLAFRRQHRQPERLQRRRRARGGCARAAPSAPRGLPLRRSPAPRPARRPASTTSCGDTCAAASSPRAAADRSRSCGTSRAARARAARTPPAPAPTARRGTSACSCSAASMPHAADVERHGRRAR